MKRRKIFLIVGIVAIVIIGIFHIDKDEKIETLPYKFESGKLEITNLITFDGVNPDNNNQNGESVASLQLTNHAKQSLKFLKIKIKMEDGKDYEFVIEDLPASAQVIALDTRSAKYDGQTKCKSFAYECEFENVKTNDKVNIYVQNNTLLINNISNNNLKNIEIIYRCFAEGFYFGGKSYQITIPELLSGKSKTYNDENCLLGNPEIISINITE